MYEPDIIINEDMMDTLTDDEKIDLIESSPTKVFDFDAVTRQVSLDICEWMSYLQVYSFETSVWHSSYFYWCINFL